MGRETKKVAVAALHREQIMCAAEKMFTERGFLQTTIEDISKASEYSRRTIYSYYESKEDILHHIIAKGLLTLKQDIETVLQEDTDFIAQYDAICDAIKKYQLECPHSLENVTQAKTSNFDLRQLSPALKQIFTLGAEINNSLATFIQKGKEQGIVRQDIIPMQTVYVLWASITALLTLIQTKGPYIAKAFSITQDEFLAYGKKQILNSILEVRI